MVVRNDIRLGLVLLGAAAVTLLFFWPISLITAQTPTPTPDTGAEPIPLVHTVQEGENLTFIAESYGVSVADLLAVNGLTEADLLAVGQTVIIPGGSGDVVAAVYTVQLGDTLPGIAAAFNTSPDALLETNRLVNRFYEPAAGQSLTIVSRTGSAEPRLLTGTPHVVEVGESLLMVAARYGLSEAQVAAANDLPLDAYLFPGQRLRIPSQAVYRFLPGAWVEVRLRTLPLVQGNTTAVYVENLLNGRPVGFFAGQSLRFFPFEAGFAALLGIDAFTAPDTYTLRLEGVDSERPWQPFEQPVLVQSGGFGTQQITVGPELAPLLEPAVRQEEDAFLSTLYSRFTETQYWEGLFQAPVTNTVVTARYGDGRSYNGGPVEIFHTGVDFAGTVGTPIFAPANGVVLYRDTLELRGQTVVIDHGLGVMSAYFHLSEMFVEVDELVEAGQMIGAGGSTGLSTGPHLHWELRVNDVAVNGLQWLEQAFP